MKAGVAKVYEDARRDGTALVVSRKPGEVQFVKVNSDRSLTVVRTEVSKI